MALARAGAVETSATGGRRLEPGIVLLLADALLISLVCTAAAAFDLLPVSREVAILVVCGAIVSAGSQGVYRRADLTLGGSWIDDVVPGAHAAAFATLALVVFGGAQHAAVLMPARLAAFAGVILALIVIGHAMVRAAFLRAAVEERCLVVGDRFAVERLHRQLRHAGNTRLSVVHTIAPDALAVAPGRLPELVASHGVDRIVIGEQRGGRPMEHLVREARQSGVRVSIFRDSLASMGAKVHAEQVGASVMLHADSSDLPEYRRRHKRMFDLAGAITGLVVLSPLLFAIAVVIRVTSYGPVFFRQQRIGRDGVPFEIYKFRTMVQDAEAMKLELVDLNEAADGLFKIERDPRVTPIGRILRRSCLDELPQLINVVRGEMSLVGPRPLIPSEDSTLDGWQRDRLRVLPGMTGPWQTMGSSRVGIDDMAVLDHMYVSNWSLAADLRVLVATAAFVLGRRGL